MIDLDRAIGLVILAAVVLSAWRIDASAGGAATVSAAVVVARCWMRGG